MIELKLLTRRYPISINEKLQEFISNNQLAKSDMTQREEAGIQVFSIKCEEEKKEALRETIAMIISDLVQEVVLKKMIDTLFRNKQTLTNEEKEAIKELFITSQYVSKEEGASYISYYMVYMPILRELEAYNRFHLEGWIRFRTKKYEVALENLLESVISNYEKQRDYLEYIRLVVKSRKGNSSCKRELQLVPETNGEIRILDESGIDITNYYINQYCQEILDEEMITQEDLILHILITVPPEQMKIHAMEAFSNKQFLQTIQMIFEESILYCNECELCKKRKKP